MRTLLCVRAVSCRAGPRSDGRMGRVRGATFHRMVDHDPIGDARATITARENAGGWVRVGVQQCAAGHHGLTG